MKKIYAFLFLCLVAFAPSGYALTFPTSFNSNVTFSVPLGFRWQPNFTIYETANGFYTDFDINAVKPSGVTKWVSKTGNDTTGNGTEALPYRTLAKAATEGANIVSIKQGIYDITDGMAQGYAPTVNFGLVSADGAGKAIVTRRYTGLSWTQQSAPNQDVYLATQGTVGAILDLTAVGRAGEYLKDGTTPVPIPLSVQSSIANVQANAGSWYLNGTSLYVRTWDNRAPDTNVLVLSTQNIFSGGNNITLYMSGMEMWGNSGARLGLPDGAPNTSIFAAQDSGFRYGGMTGSSVNGVNLNNVNYSYCIRCAVSDNFSNDGYNYTNTGYPTTNFTKGLEVDSTSRRTGNVGAVNDNGTTSHNSSAIIRINGDYQYSYGPVVADVLDAQSLNLNVLSGNSQVATFNSLQKTGFTIDGGINWMKNCRTVGPYYDLVVGGVGILYNYGGFVGANNRNNGTVTPITFLKNKKENDYAWSLPQEHTSLACNDNLDDLVLQRNGRL